ncbi:MULTISPECIES: acetyl-CoA carboxylase biotin carboxyl carrier protein [Niallia]|jgi:acetyl-CoA carboxylase biotin carboxyl carrier protein|uniref:Biotin carboxyl carrier protein of acetyl-CoA carboxylase n=1 Tax=Niallia circulans TaxID=1397 RepID=A0A268F864_NIACI|nr:acetyl-CoA carboxylase biotin carboxyl carrier protein [Niallia circulans]AYV67019.1 acetyl-CoA carboxylase biotin carboxyl carrier protein [Niallia circulans]AYV70112.1 acetyl-CoA carboxylase biotin carboxyl carrier protein [Niallia circulans]NRG27657.1 acetyl-CoA carboxylase biotin carboxyl carrier protein [Niallia circulans]PAD81576.1 acetyl-CoA carboxylase, biotin carboxyl carrier protein [Niallia circulans]QJX62909.1 acetyl-CoA carboxylase biotin carboxyl carrier protein [Niallia circu
MLKISEIKELIKLIDESTISNFLYEQDGVKVEIQKNVGEIVAQAPVVTKTIQQQEAKATKEVAVESVVADTPVKSSDDNLHKITSPMVGTFYQSASPDSPSFVKVGDKVTKDSVVCIVEAMKLFNEITAEVDGEIVEILVKDGELVEYGEPLFLVKA